MLELKRRLVFPHLSSPFSCRAYPTKGRAFCTNSTTWLPLGGGDHSSNEPPLTFFAQNFIWREKRIRRENCFWLWICLEIDCMHNFYSSFYLEGGPFKALDLKMTHFYLVRKIEVSNLKILFSDFLRTSLTLRVDFNLSFTLVISQFN